MPKWPTLSELSTYATPGTQALVGVVMAGVGVACQFGAWYGLMTAGGLLVVLAALAELKR